MLFEIVLVSVWEVSLHRRGKPLFFRGFTFALEKLISQPNREWAMTGHCVLSLLLLLFKKATLKRQQIVNSLGMETCKWWKLAGVIPKDCVCGTRGGMWCPEQWQTGSVPRSILHFSWNCSFEDLIMWCQETLQIAQQ